MKTGWGDRTWEGPLSHFFQDPLSVHCLALNGHSTATTTTTTKILDDTTLVLESQGP